MENINGKLEKIERVIGKIEKTVETHMSVIYMGDKGLVAKEIKQVDMGFVNLTSIEKRRDTAEKTAQIDRVYCPDLSSRAIEIDSIPMIIMRRFDFTKTLDKLYDQEKVTLEMAEQIGNLFAEAHKRSKTDIQISEIGNKAITDNWEDSFRVVEEALAIERAISRKDYDEIIRRVRNFILTNKDYLTMRKDSGFIRQVHGDGHAGNMFVENGTVKIFDGIGFGDEFSCVDLVGDVAWAIMDAIAHDKMDIAKTIVKTYTEKSGDVEGIEKLLDFYVCHWAFVRGQCSVLTSNGMTEGSQKELLNAGRKYFDLAVKYLPN